MGCYVIKNKEYRTKQLKNREMNYPPSIPSYKMAESCQRYKDKVTLITGGSSGIGKGLLEVFGKRGVNKSIIHRSRDMFKLLLAAQMPHIYLRGQLISNTMYI